jgi:hypothetical protein
MLIGLQRSSGQSRNDLAGRDCGFVWVGGFTEDIKMSTAGVGIGSGIDYMD